MASDNAEFLSAFLPNETKESRKDRIFSDLRLADNMISEVTGKKISVMAYPYGVPPFDLVSEIEDVFDYNIQLMVRTGVNKTIDMFNKLDRFAVNGREEPEVMDAKIKKYNGIKLIEMCRKI